LQLRLKQSLTSAIKTITIYDGLHGIIFLSLCLGDFL